MRARRLAILPLLIAVALVVAFVATNNHRSIDRKTPSSPSHHTTRGLELPVLRESFTLLPCAHNTTLGIEGCVEHRILVFDAVINLLRHQIVGLLNNTAANRDFVIAEIDWFTYRRALCSSESDQYEGGSLVPVVFANCVVRLDQRHITELTRLHSSYLGR